MVPLTDPVALSLARQLRDIETAWQAAWSSTDPETSFARWATNAVNMTLPFIGVDSGAWDALPAGRWTEAPIIAASGFELAMGRVDLADRWLAGMARLVQRDPLPVDRQSFFFRPTELLGIAVGSAALRDRDSSFASWMGGVLAQGEDRLTDDVLTQVLLAFARRAVAGEVRWKSVDTPESWLDAAVLLWASVAAPEAAWLRAPVSEVEEDLVRRALVTETVVNGALEATVAWISLRLAAARAVDATIASAAGGDVLRGVIRLCRRFPLMVREMQRRYGGRDPFPVRDEYDVQDLLRAVLVLHFDDVRPEEWTPSYGAIHSRMDFLLKTERIVIEAKMTRAGLGQREVVEQLSIDKDHYRTHPDCDRLVCLVYDPDGRLGNPVAIETDLSSNAPLPTTVIVTPRGV